MADRTPDTPRTRRRRAEAQGAPAPGRCGRAGAGGRRRPAAAAGEGAQAAGRGRLGEDPVDRRHPPGEQAVRQGRRRARSGREGGAGTASAPVDAPRNRFRTRTGTRQGKPVRRRGRRAEARAGRAGRGRAKKPSPRPSSGCWRRPASRRPRRRRRQPSPSAAATADAPKARRHRRRRRKPRSGTAAAGQVEPPAAATASPPVVKATTPPTVAPATAAANAEASPAREGFVVQLAAFADDKGANALAGKLKKRLRRVRRAGARPAAARCGGCASAVTPRGPTPMLPAPSSRPRGRTASWRRRSSRLHDARSCLRPSRAVRRRLLLPSPRTDDDGVRPGGAGDPRAVGAVRGAARLRPLAMSLGAWLIALVLALQLGAVVAAAFTALQLPAPAPQVLGFALVFLAVVHRRCAGRHAAGQARCRRSGSAPSIACWARCSASPAGCCWCWLGVLLAGLTTLPRQDWWQNSMLAPRLADAGAGAAAVPARRLGGAARLFGGRQHAAAPGNAVEPRGQRT